MSRPTNARQFDYKGMPDGRLRAGRGDRHRHRHSAGDHRQDLRAVLHHQGGRQGHRPRALDGLRHRQADRRLHLCRTRRPGRARPSASSCRAISRAPTTCWRKCRPTRRRRSPARMAAADTMARAAAADLTGHGTILLVEDEEGLRALNARGLASRGYTVLEAGNGVEALEAARRSTARVDLVVSDVVMPEMDGPTLLKELRQRNPESEDHLRLRLCRGRLQQEPAEPGTVRLPAQAVHAQAARRRSEEDTDAVIVATRGRLGPK